MKKRPNLSIIIVNYNTKELLRKCLQSIEKSKGRFSFEVIVVDNHSTDGSVVMLKKFKAVKMKRLIIIEAKKNLGFATANNLGIKKAGGKYLLFLNPDTVVQPLTLKVMLGFMDKNPRVGAATCRVELPNGQLDYSCHRGFPTPWSAFAWFSGLAKLFPQLKIFTGYNLSHLSLEKTHPIDAACGAFLIVRREAGEEIGWWDEDYFWYGEDLDFCYRLKKRGWEIMFVPHTKIIHYKGASSGIKKHSQKISTATLKTKLKAAKASTEVMRIFYKKHYQKRYPRLVNWLVMKGISLIEKTRIAKIKCFK